MKSRLLAVLVLATALLWTVPVAAQTDLSLEIPSQGTINRVARELAFCMVKPESCRMEAMVKKPTNQNDYHIVRDNPYVENSEVEAAQKRILGIMNYNGVDRYAYSTATFERVMNDGYVVYHLREKKSEDEAVSFLRNIRTGEDRWYPYFALAQYEKLKRIMEAHYKTTILPPPTVSYPEDK